jgi:hypothetical protein
MKSLANNPHSLNGIQLAEYAVTLAVSLISLLGVLRFLGLVR